MRASLTECELLVAGRVVVVRGVGSTSDDVDAEDVSKPVCGCGCGLAGEVGAEMGSRRPGLVGPRRERGRPVAVR